MEGHQKKWHFMVKRDTFQEIKKAHYNEKRQFIVDKGQFFVKKYIALFIEKNALFCR